MRLHKLLMTTFAVIISVIVSGCANKQDYGTLLGAVAGGVVGSQFGKGTGKLIAVGIGTLGGGWLGGEIGKLMDEDDRKKAQQTAQSTLEYNQIGQMSSWKNPDSGNSGSYTPTRTYKSGDTDCREFQQDIIVDGHTERAYGRACRQPSGAWKLI